MNSTALTPDNERSASTGAAWIENEALRLGFDLVAITPATPPGTVDQYRAWLEKGYHGEMDYLARPDAVRKRGDPAYILPGVRSVVTLAANYHTTSLPLDLRNDPAHGIIASYARGDDYHDVLLPRLRRLGTRIEAEIGNTVAWRACVDTGPLLERDLASRAGLGFVGKNTHLIHPRLGSWLFLGELLLTAELPSRGESVPPGRCGRCTRCLDACPTAALVAPHVLDARRCISYLTIELKGPIPQDLRPLIGNRVFGCDVCQEVCPWNQRFARRTTERAFQARAGQPAPHLLDLIALDEQGFRHHFQGSSVARARRRGLLRNVCIALGNWGDPAAVPALAAALHDPEPLIRGHAAWALGRIATGKARRALAQAQKCETDPWVLAELRDTLFI